MKTNQELFDIVAEALLAQGKPSIRLNEFGQTECMYRTPDGCKCGAGHLIPDDKYLPAMEGSRFNSNFATRWKLDFSKREISFIQDLQDAHDSAADGKYIDPTTWLKLWKQNMIDLAYDYNLSLLVLERFSKIKGRDIK